MKWNAIPEHDLRNPRHYLPKDKQFIVIWKGAVGLCQFDEEEDCFWLCIFPAQYAGIMRISRERESKFTHWYNIELPDGY